MDIPLDASPKYRERGLRIKAALEKHGSFNTYFLYNARCRFHLTNHADLGLLEFSFVGTLLTDPTDRHSINADLQVKLERETCDWLTEPVVHWFHETVSRAVMVEFDRYIDAGDLAQTIKRIAELQAKTDQTGGYAGMYL